MARLAVAEGVDAVTLHPRTRTQMFGGRADWSEIAALKQAVPVPVIASGDLFTAQDAMNVLAETGCDALMVARGGYGNPWLIRQILDRLDGRPEQQPAAAERLAVAARASRAVSRHLRTGAHPGAHAQAPVLVHPRAAQRRRLSPARSTRAVRSPSCATC